jgi:hypothetical protein
MAMLIQLLMGSAVLLANLALQILAIVFVLRLLLRRIESASAPRSTGIDFRVISLVTLTLFIGYLAQAAVWALLFTYVGRQFEAYDTAFYHSLVNFTSLGYGDIVMDERWRLMGALEAANGVLMFGIGASALLAVMTAVFGHNEKFAAVRRKLKSKGE